MTKIVASSDWHGDHVTHGVRRYGDVEAAAMRTVDAAIEEKADGYLFAGDLGDPDSGSSMFRVVELFLRVAVRCAKNGIRFLAIPGNHDVIEDGSGESVLSPLRALTEASELITLADRPGFYPFGKIGVLAFPYSPTSHAYDPLEVIKQPPLPPWIAVGHLHLPGIVPGEEANEMPRGRNVLFPAKELAACGAKAMLHGHFHKRQVTEDGVHVIGSLVRLTFNEEANEPGFLILEVG